MGLQLGSEKQNRIQTVSLRNEVESYNKVMTWMKIIIFAIRIDWIDADKTKSVYGTF